MPVKTSIIGFEAYIPDSVKFDVRVYRTTADPLVSVELWHGDIILTAAVIAALPAPKLASLKTAINVEVAKLQVVAAVDARESVSALITPPVEFSYV